MPEWLECSAVIAIVDDPSVRPGPENEGRFVAGSAGDKAGT